MPQSRRTLRAIVHGSTPNHQHLRDRLVVLWVSTIVLDLFFSVIAFFLETNKPGSAIHGYGTALFWTTTQMLTVSSQLPNPVTTGGRVLDVVMEVLAISLVTAQGGSLGSFLYRHSMEKNPMPHHPGQEPDAGAGPAEAEAGR
jgi:hypothetical protein